MKKTSGLIEEINLTESSWKHKVFITVDIDWADDDAVLYTVEKLEQYNVKATFFVTHESKTIEQLLSKRHFQVGIHPNFNGLLSGTESGSSIESLRECLNIVPSANALRSHSTTNSSKLVEEFSLLGLKYDLNYYIPFNSGLKLQPWLLWNGMVRVPYIWEDYAQLISANQLNRGQEIRLINEILGQTSLVVLNFHPIHIFNNSSSAHSYLMIKEGKTDEQQRHNQAQNFGIREIFEYVLRKLSS